MNNGPWIKSSRSGSTGNCVAVRRAADEVFVQNSNNPEGGTLRLSRDAFRAFIGEIKDGRFDVAD